MNDFSMVIDYLLSGLAEKEDYPFSDEIKNTIKALKDLSPFPLETGSEKSGSSKTPNTSVSRFFASVCREALKELEQSKKNPDFNRILSGIKDALSSGEKETGDNLILKLFHPESLFFSDNRKEGVSELRKRREIKLEKLNSSPVTDPASELIFTSNFMLTIPISEIMLEKADISAEVKDEIKAIMKDKQDFWFDHPVPAGIPDRNNELLYGLENLAETLDYEKKRGSCPADSRLTVIISVSVTHNRLKNILHKYLDQVLKKISGLENLDIYFFTENDTENIINRILIPAAEKAGSIETNNLMEVFGVDGEYGRHYSFLKAVAPLWKVLADSRKKGTFKIDLDQVFPENELISETGKSAFEHFMSPLWGAEGKDWKGRNIELGMIAGSLVNEKDIKKSIFEPDVSYPDKKPAGEDAVFFKQYPMALSTEAEMNLQKYNDPDTCQIRYHVTGGTNGILTSALRKYRPFTPTFIGRAEDQAYILSVLFRKKDSSLIRYLHQPGLKMRHDKDAFISETIKSAKTGTYIGDLVRILAFSCYSDIAGGGVDEFKEETDPFTGSFISRIPATLMLFKLLLHIQDKLENSNTKPPGNDDYIESLITAASERLTSALELFKNREKLSEKFENERNGWDCYYDIIDYIEKQTTEKNSFSEQLLKESEKIFQSCKIRGPLKT